ncbi:helix-turn-helix domain-containing protein [Saezia sanguinis]|uniref:helix-turn-helix domain-containing protein n=1 Tax=Saezia sanguinis TaxID=1965230 RepID=UPI0023B78705|nr:helix-turn-helix domain-containing protein [Saezia sanguinis]
MDAAIRKRLRWIKLYEETGNAGLVCLKCGITRPTLRKWWKRYQKDGEQGLQDQSRRPNYSPKSKISEEHKKLITELRQRKLGHRRIHESPRVLRRLQPLREWSDEQDKEILTRSARTCGSSGTGATRQLPVFMGDSAIHSAQDRLFGCDPA